jgi:hypothetical protein
MTWFTRYFALAGLFVALLAPSAQSQFVTGCRPAANSNPLTTVNCLFDSQGAWNLSQPGTTGKYTGGGFDGVPFRIVTSQVPAGVQVLPPGSPALAKIPQVSQQDCWIITFFGFADKVKCVPNTLNLTLTLTDFDFGDMPSYKIGSPGGMCAADKPFVATWTGRCGQPITISANGTTTTVPLSIRVPAQQSLVCSQTNFADNDASWTYSCNALSGQPPFTKLPNDAAININSVLSAKPHTPEQQAAWQAAANKASWAGWGVAVGALRFPALGNPLVGAGVATYERVVSQVGNDPPDPNYTTVVTPTYPSVDVSSYSSATQQLVQALEQAIGLFNAIYATNNRLTGATLAGDTNSQQLQLTALATFTNQANTQVAQLQALLAAWGQDLVAHGADPRTIALSDVIAYQQSIAANGLPQNIMTALTQLGADQSMIQQIQAVWTDADDGRAYSALQSLFNIGPLMPPILSTSSNLQQYAAVLPASRSVQVGTPATFFATIVNAGTSTAKSCVIEPRFADLLGLTFTFQTTDPKTNTPVGKPNTPVDIPPGVAETFVIAVTPTTALQPFHFEANFYCANAGPAPSVAGIDTLLFTVSTTPVPDAIAIGLTPSNDGYSHTGGPSGTGIFAVASANIGISSSLTAQVVPSNTSMPLAATVCQTNPANGQCLQTPGPTATATINQNQNTTWSAFLHATGVIPQDPANNRVIFQFTDANGVVRGSTSTAVTTQ